MRISSFPDAGLSTSLVDLSLSSANSGCPLTTRLPFSANHSASVPSFIEKPSLGRRTSVAIDRVFLGYKCNRRIRDAPGVGCVCAFQRLGERHRCIWCAQTIHGCLESAEEPGLQRCSDLCTDTEGGDGLVHDQAPACLGDRSVDRFL